MAFDDFVLRKIDRERRQKPAEAPTDATLNQAHERARKVLNNPDYSIQAPDFMDLYGRDNVLRDMHRVKEKQTQFAATDTLHLAEVKKASEVFEAIVLEQAELSNWLGQNVSLLKTSLFDDYFNGTDMIAEWETEGHESNVLALAVDVTFGVRSIEKKLERIRRDVEGGNLGAIKYFKSGDGSFRGERSGIPHVVIGVSKETVHELARFWLAKDKKALAEHPIQRVLVEELYSQLKMVHEYALSKGRQKVADAYKRSLDSIEKLRAEKAHLPLLHMEKDRVYQELQNKIESVFRR